VSFFDQQSYIANIFLKLIPLPSITFLLFVNTKVAYRRKGEGSIELYDHQQSKYLDLVKNIASNKVRVIDSNTSLHVLSAQVIENVLPMIKKAHTSNKLY
jgi:thymidylate kinase